MSKIIRVNTRTGAVASEDVKKEYQLVGQRGLIAKIMTAEVDPKADPLGPKNKLIMATGILAGTTLSTANRMSVGGKSPLTGGIKEANVGGTTGYLLSGHDIKAIVFEDAPAGKAWKIFKIDKTGKAELIAADEYAGLGTYDFVAKLKAKYGEGIGVACIGPAGERGSRNSTVQVTDASTGHPSRAAARGGLGAVMGAKGIKAVVIEPPTTRAAFPYVNRDQFAEAAKKVVGIMTAPGPASGFTNVGTISTVDMAGPMAFLPVRNFSGAFFGKDNVPKINGAAFLAKLKENGGKNGLPCQPGCAIRCSNVYNDAKGQYLTGGLEYETVALMGSNCDIADLDAIAQMDRMCDDLGVDTIETGATIAVCMDAGKIPFGDAKAAMGLIKEMADGTEFGKVLGGGTAATGKKLNWKRVPVVKGQAISGYDPRNCGVMGITYATTAMGADHTAGPAMMPNADTMAKTMRITMSGRMQTNNAVCDNLMCMFGFMGASMDPTILPNLFGGAFGGTWDMAKITQIGRDTIAMERAFNKKAGFTLADDALPEYFYNEVAPATGAVFDMRPEDMVDTFK